MKVKDLLRNIEKYRKEYPDIDEWDIFTEQPELIAPENYITYEDWFKAEEENEPTISFNEESKEWIVESGNNDFAWFETKKEAEDYASTYYQKNQNLYLDMFKSYQRIKELKKQGWKFIQDSEGWVYRETAEYGNMTLFTKEKILTINNNY